VVEFLFVIIELFSLSLMVEMLCENLSKSALFEGEWVTLSANFKTEGRLPPTTVSVRKLE